MMQKSRLLKFKVLILAVVLLVVVSCKHRNAELETYYIPNEYRGKVFIIYGVENGVVSSYKDSSRVLIVDTNGVLLSKLHFNEGYYSDVYNQVKFYLFSQTDTIEIPVKYEALDLKKDFKDNEVFVFNIHDGKYGNYRYRSFFIDTLRNGKNYPEEAYSGEPGIESVFEKYKLE